ncbi:hypothetical protein ACFYZJ_18415 [Streptomyces sp. NPDC001848]|uniref:hypothetical protein n=1 Tax=Streptomyces sp. NPDC001848 TaxID=3364618 RepID=UPI0036CBAEDF
MFVTVDPCDATFHGRLLEPRVEKTAPARFDGRFVVGAGLVLTAVAVVRSRTLPAVPER